MRRLAVFVALVFFLTGCGGAQRPKADTTIPEINGMTIVIDGQKQAIREAEVYQLGNQQYFELQVSDNVTDVEFLLFPDYAEQTQALLSRGTKIANGVYKVPYAFFTSGQGYFLVYNDNIAVRSGRFSLSVPSC